MLDQIRDKHKDKTICILGSGETAPLYANTCDVCIAVNGALSLKKEIDYFVAFDHRVIHKAYFDSKPEVTRLLGVNIATLSRVAYPDSLKVPRVIQCGLTVTKDPVPARPPHLAWTFTRPATVEELDIDSAHMYSADNVVIPAFQLAYLMGAREIHLYGIGLHKHYYFDGHIESAHEKEYGRFAPLVLNELIRQATHKGILTKATREKESKLNGVEWM
jgi:hypothetical protein